MNRLELMLAFVLALGACASTPPDLAEWTSFSHEVDRLTPEELGARISGTDERYRTSPDDLTRLQLAYLLSRPALETQDVDAGRRLLDEIATDSRYSPLRDLVQRQISVEGELQSARREIRDRNSQIELLQQQIDKLEPRADREAELRALRDKVRELEAQLDALKSIEAEMSEGQKAMDELPDE
jgi:chromosome segregation ATPase